MFSSSKKGDDKLAAASKTLQLWEQFEVYILKHNHRQGEGNSWANILNELHEGKCSEETEEILRSRIIEPGSKDTFTTFHIFYTNMEVETHNMKMLNMLPDDPITFVAKELNPRGYKTQVKPWGTIKDTKFMQKLQLKTQARVKLIWNISTHI